MKKTIEKQLFPMTIITLLSLLITHYIAGPQYFVPKIFPNGTGILEIGPIYGNVETTVAVGKMNFSYPVLISLDNKNWVEIHNVEETQQGVFSSNFTRLTNLNVEKGGVLKFFLKPFMRGEQDSGYLVFRVSAFSIFERNPQKLLLFFTIFGFLFGIYKFLIANKKFDLNLFKS